MTVGKKSWMASTVGVAGEPGMKVSVGSGVSAGEAGIISGVAEGWKVEVEAGFVLVGEETAEVTWLAAG
jgi:hypothetical protein